MACSPGIADECFNLREVSGTHLIRPYIKEAKGRPKHDPVPGSTPDEPCVMDASSSHRVKKQHAETKKAALGGFLSPLNTRGVARLVTGADGETRTLTPFGAGT